MTIEVNRLSVGDRLHDVSFALRADEVTAILGPNGAGKSTLLAAMAGLEAGSARGEVSIDSRPLAAMAPRERAMTIGYLPQVGEVAWDLTVETLVHLGRLPYRSGADENRGAVERAIAELCLQDLRHRALNRISGGERARALLGRVLAGDPAWVFADEPFASLDLAHQLGLLDCFKRLASRGTGVVLVLHDLAMAMNHADRVIVLQSGRVMADGAPNDVLDEACIGAVWGLCAQWVGEPGRRALVL